MVLLHPTDSTYPELPSSSSIKSPGRNPPSVTTKVPAKKLLSVGCTARATANPPIPNPAKIGLTDTPKLSTETRKPIE